MLHLLKTKGKRKILNAARGKSSLSTEEQYKEKL
jgi:hypothetical protein